MAGSAAAAASSHSESIAFVRANRPTSAAAAAGASQTGVSQFPVAAKYAINHVDAMGDDSDSASRSSAGRAKASQVGVLPSQRGVASIFLTAKQKTTRPQADGSGSPTDSASRFPSASNGSNSRFPSACGGGSQQQASAFGRMLNQGGPPARGRSGTGDSGHGLNGVGFAPFGSPSNINMDDIKQSLGDVARGVDDSTDGNGDNDDGILGLMSQTHPNPPAATAAGRLLRRAGSTGAGPTAAGRGDGLGTEASDGGGGAGVPASQFNLFQAPDFFGGSQAVGTGSGGGGAGMVFGSQLPLQSSAAANNTYNNADWIPLTQDQPQHNNQHGPSAGAAARIPPAPAKGNKSANNFGGAGGSGQRTTLEKLGVTVIRAPPPNPFLPERAYQKSLIKDTDGNGNTMGGQGGKPGAGAGRFGAAGAVAGWGMKPGKLPHYLKYFREMSILGSGDFSEVFRVRSTMDGCVYAVKKCKRRLLHGNDRGNDEDGAGRGAGQPSTASDRRIEELREVLAMAALSSNCPHILRYYSAWTEDLVDGGWCPLVV